MIARGVRLAGVLLAVVMAAAPDDAAAQRPRQAQAGVERRPAQNRAMLERRVRQEFYRVARTRIGLNDDQMRRLGAVNAKYEGERRTMNREERATRQALRAAVQSKSAQDQGKIDGYLNSLQQFQRRRLEVNEREQRELATFMTPAQRAKYHALQEVVRRRVDDLRRSHRDPMLGDDSITVPRR